MPNGVSEKKDYARNRAWYLAREASPAGLKKRAERAKGRAMEVKAGKLTGPHDPREVDHVKSLAKGGSGKKANLQVISEKANRRKYDH
jgi:5-methylcytosine-specific restriction endonuclease McrA